MSTGRYPAADDEELRLTAYHEAGHAAMSLWLGIPFQTLSIVGNETSDGRVIGQLAAFFRPDISWSRYHEEYIICAIRILLAGPEAEVRVRGVANDVGASGDMHQVAELAGRLHYSEDAMGGLVTWLAAAVAETSDNRTYWGLVERLASRALETRTVSYRAAKHLAEGRAASLRRWPRPRGESDWD